MTVESDFFINKVKELYGNYEGGTSRILQNFDQYEKYGPEWGPYHEIIRLSKISEENPSIKPLIDATMLHYFFENIATDDDPDILEYIEIKDDQKEVVSPEKIAHYFIKKFCIITILKSMYIFENGKYHRDNGVVRSEIQKLLSNLKLMTTKPTKNFVGDIYERILNLSLIKGEEDLPFIKDSKIIPTKKCALVRCNNQIIEIPNSPAIGKNWQATGNYVKNIDTSEVMNFLHDITNEEDAKILIQMGSQTLAHNLALQMAYMMLGDGGNGKSLVSKLMSKALGEENTSALTLQEFKDRFKSSQLCEALVNINPDIPKNGLTTEACSVFKNHTGGDRRSFENKFEKPFYDRPTTTLIFGANGLPDVPDSLDQRAWWRRWYIIHLPKNFELNPKFEDQILSDHNVDAIFTLYVEDLSRLETEGLLQSDSIEKTRDAWQKNSNNVYAFISENFEIVKEELEPEYWITKKLLYKEYEKYCQDEDIDESQKMRNQTFHQKIKHLKGKDTQKTIGQNLERVYVNLKRKFISPIPVQTIQQNFSNPCAQA
ncbi:MAG: phage/plasmid primase, P4 family [Methanoregula sp.]|jgi:putative DNA primase/helicase